MVSWQIAKDDAGSAFIKANDSLGRFLPTESKQKMGKWENRLGARLMFQLARRMNTH